MFNLNLVPTEIVIPDVKKLRVKPIDPPFTNTISDGTTSMQIVFQKIYYQLIRVYDNGNEKVIEEANIDIPFSIYSKLALFVDNSITEEDIQLVNGFFTQNGWSNIQLTLPAPEVVVPNPEIITPDPEIATPE
jgi:hypothetical protein